MSGIDNLIQKGIADPDRLGIGGWSYGGYMGMWAVTQTNRFKAPVAGAGISDRAGKFGTQASSIMSDEWYYHSTYEQLDSLHQEFSVHLHQNIRVPALIFQGDGPTDPDRREPAVLPRRTRTGPRCDFDRVSARRARHPRREAHARYVPPDHRVVRDVSETDQPVRKMYSLKGGGHGHKPSYH